MRTDKGRSGASIVDGCAGPGGWDEGLRLLGRTDVLGIEWDQDACATARAAGHARLQADVTQLDPLDFAPVEGLIFSPPCPTFSAAGKGAGRRDVDHLLACAAELCAGRDTRAEHRARCEDERSLITVEPIRWALALRPEWIALEQVPPVLPIWETFADILRAHGYNVWTGVLEAERYGVPQTRERAILMASRLRPVHPPAPTHQCYIPGEPQRHDITLTGEILPWVSMAEALGWGMTERPSVTAVAKPSESGGHRELGGGTGSQNVIDRERARGAWSYDRRQGATRPDGSRVMVPLRPLSVPAPTLGGDGLAKGRDVWVAEATKRPAPTVTSGGTGGGGGVEVFGYRDGALRTELLVKRVRVTVEEAAVLQGFRPGYPWQGTRSAQFTQVGNAVPPLLARAVLRELVSEADQEDALAA